jgi:hypothetical protein
MIKEYNFHMWLRFKMGIWLLTKGPGGNLLVPFNVYSKQQIHNSFLYSLILSFPTSRLFFIKKLYTKWNNLTQGWVTNLLGDTEKCRYQWRGQWWPTYSNKSFIINLNRWRDVDSPEIRRFDPILNVGMDFSVFVRAKR